MYQFTVRSYKTDQVLMDELEHAPVLSYTSINGQIIITSIHFIDYFINIYI